MQNPLVLLEQLYVPFRHYISVNRSVFGSGGPNVQKVLIKLINTQPLPFLLVNTSLVLHQPNS